MTRPSNFAWVTASAFRSKFTDDDLAAFGRYVQLAERLRRCRYFTDEEWRVSMQLDRGVATSFAIALPDEGATRDMLILLRPRFLRGERASYAGVSQILRGRLAVGTREADALRARLDRFRIAGEGMLASWDFPEGAGASPESPSVVFKDWLHGEYFHHDRDKAARIEKLNRLRLYELQFHRVVERLARLYWEFAALVRRVLEVAPGV